MDLKDMNVLQSAPVNCLQLAAGKFDTNRGSDAAALAKIFSEIAARKPSSFVIHFHGGLVSRESGLSSAGKLSLDYKKAEAESLFVIWETSAAEIVGQNIQRIFEEPIFQSILSRATEFVKGKLDKTLGPAGGRAISGLPKTLASEIQKELDIGRLGKTMFADFAISDIPSSAAPTPEQALSEKEAAYIEDEINRDGDIQKRVRAILTTKVEPGSKDIGSVAQQTTLMDTELVAEISATNSTSTDEGAKSIWGAIALGKRVVTVVGAVIWRYANRLDHGPYLTIVEEIMRAFYVRAAGRFLWTQMKDAVSKAFEKSPDCGGTALVQELRQLWKDGLKPCITLVGHSAGAIQVGRLLEELDKEMPADFRANIVLIAPACTFAYLGGILDRAGNRVVNLRIFGMSDEVELKDHLVPLIYPASLLYFVSGVLEDNRDEPLVGMQRYYSRHYDDVLLKMISAVTGFGCLRRPRAYSWALSAGGDGANCDMVRHGGWAEAPATLESVLHVIRKGCLNEW